MRGGGKRPLEGVRVLDLSRFIAGPFCAMLLGDLGADVVKVESPSGEQGRRTGPLHEGESMYASWFNRNKRAMALDMRSPSGSALLRKLVRSCDVLVENFRPGTLAKMGLTPEALDDLNPGLVVVSISGFGPDGPYADRVAFDAIAQAMSGLMWVNGTDASGPHMVGTFVSDHVTGLYATIGALGALQARAHDSRGQTVDVALLDATFSLLGVAVPNYVSTGQQMVRTGNRDQMVAPSGLYRCRDAHVYISAGNDEMFGRLIEATGLDELSRAEFKRLPDRIERMDQLDAIVQEWAGTRTAAEIAAVLGPAGIPTGHVASVADAVNDPQLRHRQMVRRVRTRSGGEAIVPGFVVNLSRTPSDVRLPPPTLGQDTRDVLQDWCNVGPEEFDAYTEAGAFGVQTPEEGEQ
jgi:crotonobetainyl-CoA:carnitine CoA-transferase CaiB-like acyl-CoA transferase